MADAANLGKIISAQAEDGTDINAGTALVPGTVVNLVVYGQADAWGKRRRPPSGPGWRCYRTR